jgi:hypothetical protein
MRVLRKTKDYELNEGIGMARGLFNVSQIDGEGVSYWFDDETKDELMDLGDDEFSNECNDLTN